jgi:catechol 2,3-dioxygenase-like lactoylglutathione lyase family enzyme
MNVTNLDSVVFGITDFEACRRFWTDFGLLESTAADGDKVFSCKNDSTVVLRDANDPKLPQPIEPGATQREAVFGVKSSADLAAIAAELERDRPVRVDADGTVHAVDPLGFGIAFRVARRKPITAPQLKFNTPGRPDRINTRGEFFKSATPLEMTHTVFMIDEPDKVVPFYTERLGFIASDSYPGRAYFLRGGASNHHHDLFLLNVGRRRPQHDAPRLAHGTRPRPPSDLFMLLLVFPFPLRRSGGVRLRFGRRRRALGAWAISANT